MYNIIKLIIILLLLLLLLLDAGAVVSPLSSVRERYSSPNPASSRRQLFTARKNSCGSPLKSSISAVLPKPHPPLAPKPPQGVVQV